MKISLGSKIRNLPLIMKKMKIISERFNRHKKKRLPIQETSC